jgi:hypothetical protein
VIFFVFRCYDVALSSNAAPAFSGGCTVSMSNSLIISVVPDCRI